MKLPRDISGHELVQALARLGYRVDRQEGSHIRLTTHTPSEHHITVPNHNPIKLGTLNAIIRDVGDHAKLTREQTLQALFG